MTTAAKPEPDTTTPADTPNIAEQADDAIANGFLGELGLDDGAKDDTPLEAEPAAEPPPEAAPDTEAVPAPVEEPTPEPVDLSYTVAGQQKSLDWIKEVPGVGAMIDAEHLNKLRDVVQGSEYFRAQAQSLYEKNQEYEALGGVEKVADLQSQLAATDAAGLAMLKVISDPEQLAQLALNDEKRQLFLERLQFTTDQTQQKARSTFQTTRTQAVEQLQEGPRQEQQLIGTLSQFKAALPDLTDKDVQDGYDQFKRLGHALYRKASPQEAATLGITAGDPVFDATIMQPFFLQRAAIRQEQKANEATRQATATTNATRLAASRPAPKATKAAPPTTAPKKSSAKQKLAEDDDGSYAWMKRNMQAGRFSVPTD